MTLRRTSGNAVALLTSDVMNRATSFVLYILVARNLGVHEFGQLALAFTIFYTFQVCAVAGLKTLIIREIARDRLQTWSCLVNGWVVVTCTSFASLTALLVFVRVMHYPADTARVILLLSLGLLPYALAAVCEATFQAWEQMRYIAYVNVPVNVGKIAGAFMLLHGSRGLHTVILIILSSLAAIAIVETGIILRRFPRHAAGFDRRIALRMVRSGSTFLAIDAIIAIDSSLGVILLSKLATETQVGLYSAAMQLMVPLSLVYQSAAQSIFPVMCRHADADRGIQSLRQIAEGAMEILLVLALPAVAGIFFLGGWALSLVYKSPVFLDGLPALRILAWLVVFQVFTSVLGQVLMASRRERIPLRIVAVTVMMNLLLGWPLISHYGLVGAAVTSILTRLVGCIQHYVPVSRLFSGISVGRIVWKPLVASACMVAYLALPVARPGVLTGVAAALIYAGALLVVTIWVSGGLRPFKAKYLPLLSQ